MYVCVFSETVHVDFETELTYNKNDLWGKDYVIGIGEE